MTATQPLLDFDLLTIGLSSELIRLLEMKCESFSEGSVELRFKHVSTSDEFANLLENFQLKPGSHILVSDQMTDISHYEVAQSLASCFKDVKSIFITDQPEKMSLESLKKNGFSEIFFLPHDRGILKSFLQDYRKDAKGGGTRKYKQIKMIDVEPETQLPFRLWAYLPQNKRFLVMNPEGSVSVAKFNKLTSCGIKSVFIEIDEVKEFYRFVAERLASLGKPGPSETERSEILKKNVRNLFQSLLDSSNSKQDFQSGRDLLDQTLGIVQALVEKKLSLDFQTLLIELDEAHSDFYSHSHFVSSIACLLSLGTGIGNPEDLALAGLFHDLGLSRLFDQVSIFDFEKLNEKQKEIYVGHPQRSLNLLKEKKMTVTPIVSEMIEKHHERADGKGFPAGLAGHKIPLEAQLLAYADAFESCLRTAVRAEDKLPKVIHERITSHLVLSPDVTTKIAKLMSSEANKNPDN